MTAPGNCRRPTHPSGRFNHHIGRRVGQRRCTRLRHPKVAPICHRHHRAWSEIALIFSARRWCHEFFATGRDLHHRRPTRSSCLGCFVSSTTVCTRPCGHLGPIDTLRVIGWVNRPSHPPTRPPIHLPPTHPYFVGRHKLAAMRDLCPPRHQLSTSFLLLLYRPRAEMHVLRKVLHLRGLAHRTQGMTSAASSGACPTSGYGGQRYTLHYFRVGKAASHHTDGSAMDVLMGLLDGGLRPWSAYT